MARHQTVPQALDNYETERAKLLHNEENHDVLWRVVVAADTLAETVAWWESYDNDDANI